MCGIIGLVDPQQSQHDATQIGLAMLDVTSHRGPDHRGIWCTPPVVLGHNRLSIIDLSSASNQPMTYGDLTITYNGEVYNYIELRQELESDGFVFTTSGDTEVILAAYRRWGHACVERFIGMWSFAIWDDVSKELFCSRDRFGIKPFHYIERDGRLYFASEIKGLKGTPLFRGGLNEAQVARGLYLGWMHHHEETYFNDIKALPASHNLIWQNGRVRIVKYADVDTYTTAGGSFEEHAAGFRDLFTDSVRLTARRDVPMGVCLSGGLDSTSIVSTLASSTDEHRIKTFTAYYTNKGEVDERPYIDHVLKAYPQIEAHYISPGADDIAAAIDRITWIMDAPMPSSSYVSQYFVMQLASQQGVKVVLDGQGSDEIMGGYMHSMYRIIADHLRGGHIGEALADLNAHGSRQGYSAGKRIDILGKSVLSAVRDEPSMYALEFRKVYPWILRQSANDVPLRLELPAGSKLNGFLYNLLRVTLLPTLLHTEDVNAMAFSIESRVPFLDHRLVQYCFSLPNDHKVHRGETKRVLRAGMRGIVPDAVLDRKDKTGFTTPGHITWLRGPLAYLLDGKWEELDDIVDHKALMQIIDQYRRGENRHALFVWRLAMLRAFLRTA